MRSIYTVLALIPLLALSACAGAQTKRVATTPNMIHFMNKGRAPASVTQTESKYRARSKQVLPTFASTPLPAPRSE